MRVKRFRIVIQPVEEEMREVSDVLREAAAGRRVKARRQLTFDTVDALRQVLTPERLRLLTLIRRRKPGSVYELSRMAGRDRKSVDHDLEILIRVGLVHLARKSEGRTRSQPEVPYGRIEIAVEV